MLTIQLHPAPRPRMSGVITLLPLYEFMLWTETTLPLHFLEAPVGSSGSIASKHTVLSEYEFNCGKVAQFRSLRTKVL